MEGWVDLGTAVSVQPVPKAAYRSDFREYTNFCPQRDSNLGPPAQKASVLPLDHCDCDWNDVVIAETCYLITTSFSCPPFWYSVENGVAHGRSRVRECGLIGNAISALKWHRCLELEERYLYIRPPSTRWYTNRIVLQSAVNESTFEVLYNALMVIKSG